MLGKFWVVVILFQTTQGKLVHPVEDVKNSIEQNSSFNWSKLENYLSGLQFIQKVYLDCSRSDVSTCLKTKLVKMMDRIVHAKNEVSLMDGVSFVRDTNVPIDNFLSTNKIEEMLPRNLKEKEDSLNDLIMDKFIDFFKLHKLQIKLPTLSETDSGNIEEGRGRRRRGLFIVPLIIAGTLVPLALGALALFAGKALLISKLALVLAIIIGLKKLLGGGEGEKSHEVYISPNHDSGHSRAYHLHDAHKLVYKGYIRA